MSHGNTAPVQLGIDHLRDSVAGKRLALMMNHSALDWSGRNLIDVMHRDWQCDIRFLLGMEHGVRGELSAAVKVPSQADPLTGLPVLSLYDYPGLRPPAERLAEVDAVVFCAQDAGVRNWTYTPWMMTCMDAAAQVGTQVIVVDRPNPLGGVMVEGGVVESSLFSLLGGFAYPLRHGMTSGELALMYNDRHALGCDLTVIPMQGWRRDMWYEQTGLLWLPPSPNIPVPGSLLAYAATGMLGATGISVGIGTTVPFLVLGAPWADSVTLAERIRALGLPGLLCLEHYFLPKHAAFAEEVCSGVYFIFQDRDACRPVSLALHLFELIYAEYGDKLTIRSPRLFDQRAGTMTLRETLLAGRSLDGLRQCWEREAVAFTHAREPYLLYR